jgi:hypothetical protein
MLSSPKIQRTTALLAAAATALALIVSAPAFARAGEQMAAPSSQMPESWEVARERDATAMTQSHQDAVLAAQAREAADRAAARAAKAKVAAEREAARERAARSASRGGTPAQNRALGMQMCAARGWSDSQCNDLGKLWQKESGWRADAHNSRSGAHGIPQAMPGSKMASHGSDWATSAKTQIAWGLDYIASRYGNPSAAWAHSVARGWY